MSNDITALAQRMKAAAEQAGNEQWQTRKGFSGVEVIVKGSLAKGIGCVSFQPVASDFANGKTAKTVALFSPANVLALIEALEKAQHRMDDLESRAFTSEKLQESAYRAGLTTGWNLGLENNSDKFNKCLAAHSTAGELEPRTVTVKLPARKIATEFVDDTFDRSDLAAIHNTCRLQCKNAIVAAGIQVIEGEGK